MLQLQAVYSNYRDEVSFYGCNFIVTLLILFKIYLHERGGHNDHSEFDVGRTDAFKAVVFLSFGTALPMSVDVVIDLFSTKVGLPKHLLSRGFICVTLLLTSGLHYHVSIKHEGVHSREYTINIFAAMMSTTLFYQLKQRSVEGMISSWKYLAVFGVQQTNTLLRVYDPHLAAFYLWNTSQVFVTLCILYMAGKHLYMTMKGSVQQDWHEMCQLVAFEVVLYIMLIAFMIVRVLYPRTSPSEVKDERHINGVIAYMVILYVSISLMGLIITNDYRSQYAKLEQKLVVKRKFVSYVSHEVRTPLNNCTLGVNYMKNVLSSNPTEACVAEVREILDEVDDGCRTAVDFMNNLLLYEKTDSMDLPLFMDAGDLGVVCSEVVSSFQMSARHNEVSLSCDIHDSLLLSSVSAGAGADAGDATMAGGSGNPPVMSTAMSTFDYGKIVIVFRNLLSNALKFTPKHGKVSLSVLPINVSEETAIRPTASGILHRLRSRDNTILYSSSGSRSRSRSGCYSESGSFIDERQSMVYLPPASPADTTHYRVILSDTGRGMSLEEQRQLFTKIVQFSPNENQKGGGSGIGLFLSHQIMSRHGLQIQVYSDGIAGIDGAEGGTHFYVDFPVCVAPEVSGGGSTADVENNLGGVDDGGSNTGGCLSSIMETTAGCCRGCIAKRNDAVIHARDTDNTDREESVTPLQVPSNVSNVPTAPGSNNMLSGNNAALNQSSRVTSRMGRASSIQNRELTDLSVLIVDDSVINRKMVTRTLRQNDIGSSIEGVGDGTELLTLLGVGSCDSDDLKLSGVEDADDHPDDVERHKVASNDTYDVILLDDHMTHMDGSVAVRKLRAYGYKGLIVGVTGSATDEDMQEFCDAGVDFALPKPFVVKELLQILNSQLKE